MEKGVRVCWFLMLLACLATFYGCSATSYKPTMSFGNFGIETDFTRGDLVVMDSVEGTSSETNLLLGLVSIIDGNKVKFLGIPLGFTEKYTETGLAPPPRPGNVLIDLLEVAGQILNFSTVKPSQRAYYKALEKAPEADMVFHKSIDNEWQGIPLLFETFTVTYKGKAIQIKTDK